MVNGNGGPPGRDPDPDELRDAIRANRPVETPEQTYRQLNLIQQLLAQLDPEVPFEQEIQAALLELIDAIKNQDGNAQMGRVVDLLQQQVRGRIDQSELPLGQVGIALENLEANEVGEAVFETWAGNVVANVEADLAVNKNQAVKISGPSNQVSPASDAARPLGFGSLGVDSYERAETGTNVTIQPGETKVVLTVDPAGGADIISVGTNDETHSLYQYYVDGEPLNDAKLKEPLGLYNDPYQFPSPLGIGDTFEVEVERQSSAGGSAEYFSKATYFV